MYRTLGHIIRRRAENHPEKPAVISAASGDVYTYEDLEGRSNRVAQSLKKTGTQTGDIIVGLLKNSIEYFDLLFAASKLGAIFTPLNYRLAHEEIANLIDNSSPRTIIFKNEFENKLQSIQNLPEKSFCIGANNGTGVDRSHSYDQLLSENNTVVDVQGNSSNPTVMLYTSGSTGQPKGVPITNKNLIFSSLDDIIDTQLTDDDVTLTSSPLFHVGGLAILTLPLLQIGGKVVLQQRFEPAETWELIERYEATKMFSIPTMLNMMLNVDGWSQDYSIQSLEYILAGGEPVPPETREQFQDNDIPVLQAYGMTESAGIMTVQRADSGHRDDPKCIGKQVTHIGAKIVDEERNELPQGSVGEIALRGPSVTGGYWNAPEKTQEAWDTEGWFYTGDLGKQDEEGYVYMYGRKDNMFISGGENIYPSEIENHLYSHPEIVEAVIFGVEDEKWGQVAKAVLVTNDDTDITVDEVSSFLQGKIASFKHPKQVETVDALPKSGSGKIQREEVVNAYT